MKQYSYLTCRALFCFPNIVQAYTLTSGAGYVICSCDEPKTSASTMMGQLSGECALCICGSDTALIRYGWEIIKTLMYIFFHLAIKE